MSTSAPTNWLTAVVSVESENGAIAGGVPGGPLPTRLWFDSTYVVTINPLASTNGIAGRYEVRPAPNSSAVLKSFVLAAQSPLTVNDGVSVDFSTSPITFKVGAASAGNRGTLSADHWTLLDGATADDTGSTLALRTTDGGCGFAFVRDDAGGDVGASGFIRLGETTYGITGRTTGGQTAGLLTWGDDDAVVGDPVNVETLELAALTQIGVTIDATLAALIDTTGITAVFRRPALVTETRVDGTVPHAAATNWAFVASMGALVFTNLLTGGFFHRVIDVPNGATITGVRVRIHPAGAHADLPDDLPTLIFAVRDYATGTVTPIASQVDTSADVTAYQLSHEIAIAGLTTVVDASLNEYLIAIIAEDGTFSLVGTQFIGSKHTRTLPADGTIGD